MWAWRGNRQAVSPAVGVETGARVFITRGFDGHPHITCPNRPKPLAGEATGVTDPSDEAGETATDPDGVDDLPTISCERCGREWDLSYELDELRMGNQAVEQFALDHQRHTGHFPDEVSVWQADCRQCPEGVLRLSEQAVSRWAETHARHTTHAVDVSGPRDDSSRRVLPPSTDE